MLQSRIARYAGVSESTVSRVLARAGMSRLSDLNPAEPVVRRQLNTQDWPALKARFAAAFKTRSRQEWCDVLEGPDVCFAPVLDIEEAVLHPHNVARQLFPHTAGGSIETQIAPRFNAL